MAKHNASFDRSVNPVTTLLDMGFVVMRELMKKPSSLFTLSEILYISDMKGVSTGSIDEAKGFLDSMEAIKTRVIQRETSGWPAS